MPRIRNFSFVLALISCIFISCPCDVPEWMLENGQEIKNFPEWTTSCSAFSPWMDWQSEDGQRLHNLVDDSIISDDFTGKFRIGLRGQNITIGFNNSKGSWINLYNWYGEVTSWENSTVCLEQENPESKYIYDCFCKKQKTESAMAENKSKVEITKISDKKFNYKQTIVDKLVIDCDFYNLAQFCVDLETNFHTEHTEVPIKFCEYFPISFSDKNESCFYFYPVDEFSSYRKIATFPNDFFRYVYCSEGISFREINGDKNKISFNLLDAVESDYIDYFEIQVISKEDVKIHFYKEDEAVSVLVNTLEKPELRFEWLVNSETGETKIY